MGPCVNMRRDPDTEMVMSTVPFLMFNDEFEAAIAFYTSTFPNSEIKHVARSGKDGPLCRW